MYKLFVKFYYYADKSSMFLYANNDSIFNH